MIYILQDKSESPKPQHKKPPVGGVSMFGPGAGALLPGLKKKQDKPEDEQADVKQDKGEEIKSLAKKPGNYVDFFCRVVELFGII